MSERDELFQLMLGRTTTKAVERILAAGYRKPRTITTAEELDALADDAVVLDSLDGPLIKVGRWFHSPSDEMNSDSIILPATVLYEPSA